MASDEQVLRGFRWRRVRPTLLTAIIALAAQSCGVASNPPEGSAGRSSGGASGGDGLGGSAGVSGGITISVGGFVDPLECDHENLFSKDTVVSGAIGPQRVFYSWTTDEQVAELRAGGPLFSRSESPGKGRGLALTQLEAFAASDSGPAQQLAGKLADTVFAKLRYSWVNPWATLMGWPGETYGNQLLQVELKPEAWIAVFVGNELTVFDATSQQVDLATALATPERIGAIYFQATTDDASHYCGSFSQGTVAFREFVLGNLHMVKRWSLATPELKMRLEQDIRDLQTLGTELACLQLSDQASWSAQVSCQWVLEGGERAPLFNYELALGIPSELYYPTADNLQALIAALKTRAPSGEPLDVTPED